MTYYTEKPWIGLINEAQDRNFHWVCTVLFTRHTIHSDYSGRWNRFEFLQLVAR